MRKKILLSVAFIATSLVSFAQVGVGTTTPNASAALDVTSTTRGFLPPRMTKVQMEAIATPAEGLMVYCTDCIPKGVYVNNGSTFVSMTGVTASGDVYSTTGKIWMDRNLGASQVATSSIDAASYGDLYQWGRKTDGHQIRTSGVTAGPVTAGTEGANFVANAVGTFDWLSAQDDTRWQTAAELNNPCPTNYRVPTETELNNERLAFTSNNSAGAYASPLKLPLAGYRKFSNGVLTNVGGGGYYWTSTVSGSNARNLDFSSSSGTMYSSHRAEGISVRCIKE